MNVSTALPRNGQMRQILFTEGSSTSAREAVYALGPQHKIDILDPAAFCQCRFSRYVRRWYRCPSFSKNPEAYLSFLIDRLRSERYDVLLPTHEQVYLLSRFRDELQRYVAVALPDFQALDRMIGKADFARLLEEVDLPQPGYTIVRDRACLVKARDFPCYVKLSHSTAGTGVQRVEDAVELREVADRLDNAGWLDGDYDVLVQRPAPGTNGGVTGIFQHGRLVAAHCVVMRFENLGGWAIGVQSVWHPQAVEDLRRLGEYLNWHGALCLEYCYDEETDQFQYIECNPRIAETLNATFSGVNLCEQLVRVSLGEHVEPLEPGSPGLRSHQYFLILMAKAFAGGNRLELIRESVRCLRKQGVYHNSEDQLTRPSEDWLSILPAVAITTELLLWPRLAQRIVSSTVENYSLSAEAVQRIRRLRPTDVRGLEELTRIPS